MTNEEKGTAMDIILYHLANTVLTDQERANLWHYHCLLCLDEGRSV